MGRTWLLPACLALAACAGPAGSPPANGPDEAGLDESQDAPVTLRVSAKATGAFGSLLGGIGSEEDPTALHMILAAALDAGERVTVAATGHVALSEGNQTSPDGLTPEDAPPASTVFPLQERDADSGLRVDPAGEASRLGALMGACVPVQDPATFVPLNDDPDPTSDSPLLVVPDPLPVGGIPAAALFYVGAGPLDYTATESCVLFLGVNDAFAPNNSGAYDVTISRASAAP
jgi:hypothetical protein